MDAAREVSAGPRVDRRKDDIVTAHMPLVGHLVREMLARVPAHVDRDDLTSAGFAALVAAARGFDVSRGVPFARFAAARVRGALLDELRGLDWASRSVRQRARKNDGARQQLTAELGRIPTHAEIAERLEVPVEEVAAADDDVQRAIVFSLQGFSTGTAEDMITEPTPGPEDLLIRRERLGYLKDAVEVLPERLRTVIIEYFFRERPMVRIAEDLGVTESRVSQLRTEALTLLRDGLNVHLDPQLAAQGPQREGCVARRREAYYAQIDAQGDLRSRLSRTAPDGLPVDGLPVAA